MEKKKEKEESLLKKLFAFAGSYQYLSILSAILAAVSAFIALVPFYYIWKIMQEILRVKLDFTQAVGISSYGWKAVGFALLGMLIYIVALLCSHIAAFHVQASMRTIMMEHIMKLPLGCIESEGSGKIRKIVTDSSAATETYLAHNLPDKAVSAATPAGLLILMAVFDWRLGLICLIPAGLGFLFMGSMMGKEMEASMKEYQNSLETMSAEAVEYVRGIPVVKTFGQTVFSFKRFKEAIDDYEKWTIDYTKKLTKPMIGFTTAVNSVFAFLILAAYLLGGKGISAEFGLNLFFYIIITPVLTTTLMKLAYAGEAQLQVKDALMRMDELMKREPLPETAHGQIPKDSSLTLENVTFAYEGAEKNAIDHISMKVPAGEHIAFVGPSGGGKTTLASLIARFWDANKGTITVGGMNVSDIDPETLLSLYSIVFQDVTLFNNTVMENIRIGRKDATDEEVMAAAKLAHCDEFIEKMPEKWNSMIGENGSELSGGERQRISIARAFLKDAPIILMDEATASLDVDNESLIQESISRLIQNKTVLIIAHRMRTVDGVDKIIVLKDGVVAESGTPEYLKAIDGIYRHMADLQMQSEQWKYQRA